MSNVPKNQEKTIKNNLTCTVQKFEDNPKYVLLATNTFMFTRFVRLNKTWI